MNFLNIAFYKFVEMPAEQLPDLKAKLKDRAIDLELQGTILLSEEGINGFVAGLPEKVEIFRTFLAAHSWFADLPYKDSFSDFNPFTRMLVKIKKEIIPVGDSSIKPYEATGPRISPKELKAWLDEGRDFALIDTRNGYEIEEGTFKNATHLGLRHFRRFAEKLKTIAPEVKEKPVVMFCTGGIRCEKATAIALRQGFKDVYQLDGGILKYFEDVGGEHYEGNCFVFDHRGSVNPKLESFAKRSGSNG